ncbi:hypothetical protein BGZ96_005052 [Linnemannia gamsii]|uniref:Kelch repeat protein n=1 Tax=Linnemannia gamsii TaxID=64522 RepID=A0ABQ7K5J8_9FUNG|nr:hypothetical protein BGZ96_005052 [Linnemannia gamsii]
MGYTTIDESTFYIIGGIRYTDTSGKTSGVSQFYSLDLTQSGWETSSPPWKALTFPTQLEAPTTSRSAALPISVSPDRRTFTVWSFTDPRYFVNHDIGSTTWGSAVNFTMGTTGGGIQALTDLTTSNVYFLGPTIPDSAGYAGDMWVYNASAGLVYKQMPGGAELFYSGIWSQVRKTFIFFANFATRSRSTNDSYFREYSPSVDKWTYMTMFESSPSIRYKSCMASAYNGTRILLYGGNTVDGQSVATLDILDLPTMKWSKGPDAPEGRSEMACSVSGDNFIVFGGQAVQVFSRYNPTPGLGVSATPLIYNIYTGKWTQTYTRGFHPDSTFTPDSEAPGKDEGGKGEGATNGAVIGGGIAGAVVVIGVIVFIIIRRRRQRGRQQLTGAKEPEATSHHGQDPVLPALMDNPHSVPVTLDELSQAVVPSEPQMSNNNNNNSNDDDLKVVHVYGPQGIPNSPHSQPISSTNPQDYHAQTSHQDPAFAITATTTPVQQDPRATHTNNRSSTNPQYDPTVAGTLISSTERAPQGIAVEAETTAPSYQNLQDQIDWLKAELIRQQHTKSQ